MTHQESPSGEIKESAAEPRPAPASAVRPARPITDRFPALPPLPVRRPIWTDRWALALALLGLVANATLAFVLWQRFETFPDLIALHYNAFGEADIIGGKAEIYKLPLIGAVIWGSNAALAVVSSPYDRVMARAALGVTLIVQTLICLGAWRVLT